ncbi:MAG TPA: DUF5682 family protein, partial [Chthoniobacteraceae bacterium]|nr:DUF5682 family protein [Chthoniobacteraceae bacterium]
KLTSGPCVYFPVRHHSPACSWHLQKLIEELKPWAILIEGPAQFTPLIPLILKPATRAPFAVYTQFIDNKRQVHPVPAEGPDPGPSRFAAYYPFCDYSPELVALRAGAALGCRLRFIDLDYAEQVVAEYAREEQSPSPRVESLLREHYLQRSAYLRALAVATGCRDSNELWDHLFESQVPGGNAEAFIRATAAYCFFARQDTPLEQMQADGTLQREAAMAEAVQQELNEITKAGRTGRGRILVVTGGFHTVVLPALVEAGQSRPKSGAMETTPSHLIRYSFEQLDALNGYGAGMPSPFYYHEIWSEAARGGNRAFEDVASRMIVEIGAMTRSKGLQVALSTADEIAALQQTRLLADMRGRPGPLREDLLDGIRSCFVKGSLDAEGAVVLGLAHHVLTGTAIGDIPPEAGETPIVTNFREKAKRLRLNLDDSVRRKLSLEIYRNKNHRESSRFLHSLQFINVPFGTLQGGPDFVRGTQLHLLLEHWDYAWSPATEAALVNASIYGATVEEAALNRLREAIARLDDEAKGRSAGAAVEMLVRACRMGLQAYTAEILEQLESRLGEDPLFISTVNAAMQLLLLWQSREPLEAHDLKEIPGLIRAAYFRCSYLTPGLSGCPDAEIPAALQALLTLRELLAAGGEELLDPEIFWSAAQSTWNRLETPPVIAGGLCGMLRSANRVSGEELGRATAGHIGGSKSDWRARVGFLQGVLATCRETAWQNRAFLDAINGLLAGCDEADFLRALPELRLAFANLTPRETDKVGEAVASIHGRDELGGMMNFDLTEAELERSHRLSQAVLKSLRADGLADLVETPEKKSP